MQVKYVPVFLYLILAGAMFAQDIDFEGYGSAGIIFYDRNPLIDAAQVTYQRAKLQAEIDFDDGLKAQVDMRGNSTENSMEFKEFSFKYEYFDRAYFEIGNLKRPFGYEYLVSREDLFPIDRSLAQAGLSYMGYNSRNIAATVFYDYDKDEPEFPYTYYVMLFKDNSSVYGVSTRFRYHFDDDYSLGGSYQFQKRAGESEINVHGIAADFVLKKKKYELNAELFYAQDPVESWIRRLAYDDESFVYASGARLMGRYTFETDYELMKKIEPVLMYSHFLPDMSETGDHILQVVAGVNIYPHKALRVRFNGDLRLTKNRYADEYTTTDSRMIMEFQVKF